MGAPANFMDETFEGSGYAVMSGTQTVGAASSMDPDYPTYNVGAPSGWAQQCLRCVSGAATSQCRKDHALGASITDNAYFRDEVVLTTSVGSGNQSIIASVWGAGVVGNIFHLNHLVSAGDIRLQLEYADNGGARPTSTATGLAINTRYTMEVNYNFTAKTWEFRVNEVTIGSGSLTGVIPTTLGHVIVGSHVFGGTTALTIVHDNVGVSDQGFMGMAKSPQVQSSLLHTMLV